MKLTVVGCAGSFPGPASPASCYLIEHEGTRLLLDMGNGSLGALAQYVDIYSIDAVALSHLHADHCCDLASFYVARKYADGGAKPAIGVYGPHGTAERIAQTYGHGSAASMGEIYEFIEYNSDPISIGSITLTAHPVRHCISGYALRVQANGRSLIYSGDTSQCDELVEASRGADVALYEASYLSRKINETGIHMTGTECAETAIAAGVDRLILTHLVPWNDQAEVLAEATAMFTADVQLATPGLEVEI